MAVVSPVWIMCAFAKVSGGPNFTVLADLNRPLLLSQFHNESYAFRRSVRLYIFARFLSSFETATLEPRINASGGLRPQARPRRLFRRAL
jgi:hypothetical protein